MFKIVRLSHNGPGREGSPMTNLGRIIHLRQLIAGERGRFEGFYYYYYYFSSFFHIPQ